MMPMLRPLIATATQILVLISALVIGIGIPLFWIWVGSQVQGDLGPSLGALLVVLAGVAASYAALVYVLAWLKAHRGNVGISRASWTRSMRDTPNEPQEINRAETAVVLAVIIVALAFGVWFFLAGDPGTPTG